MEALDAALGARPTPKRWVVLALLAGLWLVPQPPYVRYFGALPFDASGRCVCGDAPLTEGGTWEQQVAAAAAGGAGCCPAKDDRHTCAAEVDPKDCGALVDATGTSCLAADKPGCASSACVICGPKQRLCEEDSSTMARAWDLYCGEQTKIGLLGVVFYFGVLFGALTGATLSDLFGRRPVTVAGELAAGGLTLAMAAAPGYTVYACLQFGAGFATSVCNISGFTLAAELTGPANRTKVKAPIARSCSTVRQDSLNILSVLAELLAARCHAALDRAVQLGLGIDVSHYARTRLCVFLQLMAQPPRVLRHCDFGTWHIAAKPTSGVATVAARATPLRRSRYCGWASTWPRRRTRIVAHTGSICKSLGAVGKLRSSKCVNR